MEKLIDFLLGNFYWVIIVIGLVYTMFFRKSPLERPPEQRPARRPAGRMPDFGGSPLFPPKAPGSVPEERGPAGRETPLPVERRAPRPEFAGPAPAERSRPQRPTPVPPASPPAPDVYRPAFTPPTAAAAAAAASDEARGALSRDDLTRAIVWAEILGPPRARRPFRR